MVEINLSLNALSNLLKRFEWNYNTIEEAGEETLLLELYTYDNAYIHGFTITHNQDTSNLFAIKWKWGNNEDIKESYFPIYMPTKGTILYTDLIPINNNSPVNSLYPITIEMQNPMPGAFIHVGLLIGRKP